MMYRNAVLFSVLLTLIFQFIGTSLVSQSDCTVASLAGSQGNVGFGENAGFDFPTGIGTDQESPALVHGFLSRNY